VKTDPKEEAPAGPSAHTGEGNGSPVADEGRGAGDERGREDDTAVQVCIMQNNKLCICILTLRYRFRYDILLLIAFLLFRYFLLKWVA
jgi:hypothetical protein